MKASKEAQQWEKVHIFISSTFNDMHAERDYLVKRVFPDLQDWCERRKLRLVDIDLRWGVTEADASGKRAVKVCLERINDCRPFFLCFLGQRHGWTPGESGISDDTFERFPDLRADVHPAASVTELEIRHAIIKPFAYRDPANHGRLIEYQPSQQAFFYFRDPGYLAALPETPRQLRCTYTDDVGPEDETPDERASRERSREALRALREEMIPHAARHEPIVYGARWRADFQTPELAMPLEISSVEGASVHRWQDTWNRFAHIGLAETQLRVPNEHQSQADEYNAALTQGRLSDFHGLNPTGDRFPAGADLAEIIQQDLQRAIITRFPDHQKVEHESELQKEIDQQEQFLFTASEGFIEREGDFAELDDYVESDSNQLFVLTALGGMGKSTLLANWVDRYRGRIEGRADHSIHFRFIGQSDGTTTVYSLLRLLLSEIKEVAQKLDEEIPLDPVKLRNEWPVLLEAIGKRGPTVIVIDALNQLDSGLTDVGWLPRQLPENIKLIVSFKRGDDAAEKLYERFSEGNQVTLSSVKPFESLDDRRRLVRAYLKQYLKELDEQQVETLINLGGAANPLYLKVVLSELRVFGAYGNLEAKIRSDFGDTPVSAFVGVLRRLEKDPAYSPIDPRQAVSLLFGLLAHSRRGLSVDELAGLFIQALGHDDTAQCREAATDTVNLFLRQVRSFLARREGHYDFFFESFKIAAQQCYVAAGDEETIFTRSHQEWHKLLANYFASLTTWQEAVPSSQASQAQLARLPTLRKVAELPHHLIQVEQREGVEETLCDLDFVDAKCAAGMLFDLLRDCDRAAELSGSTAIAQVRRALTLALPSLSERPALALQTIYNRLAWFERLEPPLDRSLSVARSLLDQRQFWISAEAPLPGSNTDAISSVNFDLESSLQSFSSPSMILAIASIKGDVEMRNMPSGELLGKRSLRASRIAAIALSDDPGRIAYLDLDGIVRSDEASAYLVGRRGERLLAYHSTQGIIAVRSDDALVAWHSDQDQTEVLATDLPAPLVVLKIGSGTRSVLYVAGFKNQKVGVATWTGSHWITKTLPYSGPQLVDADLDFAGLNVLVATINRRLCLLNTQTGETAAELFYEAQDSIVVRGAPLKCSFGIKDSLGWAFFATRVGHIACWNWQDDQVKRLEDYQSVNQLANLIHFQVLETTGELLFTTEAQARMGRKDSYIRPTIGHLGAVSSCCFTISGKIVSAGEVDQTIRWFSAAGLSALAQQARDHWEPSVVSRNENKDDVIVGTRAGYVWSQPQDGDVPEKEAFVALAEPIVSVFSAGADCAFVAGQSGRVLRIHLLTDRVDRLWHSTGNQKQRKILPAGRQGLYWSFYENDVIGQKELVLSLVTKVNKEQVVLRLDERQSDVAVSRDGATICSASKSVEILRLVHGTWATIFRRHTAANKVVFLGEDDELIVIALREGTWLEVWRIAEGLPTVAAIELGATLSCLSSREDRIVAGFFSGDLMSACLHRRVPA